MEARLWRELYWIVSQVSWERVRGGRRFSDALIVLTLLWAAFNHRPISWAVVRQNWPVWVQRWVKRMPSSTTMSRRLRSPSVQAFLDAVLERAQSNFPRSMILVIDGKPLVIGGGSKDRQARPGRAVGGMARGYKLHMLMELSGRIVACRIAAMADSEQKMAVRLLRGVTGYAYGLGDGNYDSNKVHRAADCVGVQMVVMRRRPFTSLGHHRHTPGRLRSIELTEGPSGFGATLLNERDSIERQFGNLTSFSAGLGPLPAWVRTHHRVSRWVQAKLIINAVRIATRMPQTAAA